MNGVKLHRVWYISRGWGQILFLAHVCESDTPARNKI
jgi:hypothetical protein